MLVNRKKSAVPEWLVKRPIAHRGIFNNKNGVPENSLLAFQKAIDSGFPFEMDLRMLACGTFVLFHDEKLGRLTQAKGVVAGKAAYKEVKELKLLGTSEKVPTLEEMLELVLGKVPLMIELKNISRIGINGEKLLRILAKYNGEFSVHSYSSELIGWFADNAPDIPRGLVFSRFTHELFSLAVERARPKFVAFKMGHFDSAALHYCRSRHLPTIAYTVRNDGEQAVALKNCDNFIFERFIPRADGINAG